MYEKLIGAHVSASGGVELAPVRAHEIGANAFALFTKTSANGQLSHWKRAAFVLSKPIVKMGIWQ